MQVGKYSTRAITDDGKELVRTKAGKVLMEKLSNNRHVPFLQVYNTLGRFQTTLLGSKQIKSFTTIATCLTKAYQ